jgi:hypothetical protein
MSEQRDYAARTAIHAFYSHSQLLIVAEGELPSPEYEIDISQSPTDTGIPTFHLTRRPRPTATDAVQPTPFRYGEIFSIGRPPDIVLVRHAAGFDEVHVEFTRKDLVDIVLSLSGGSIEVALSDPEPDEGIPPPPPHAPPLAEDSRPTSSRRPPRPPMRPSAAPADRQREGRHPRRHRRPLPRIGRLLEQALVRRGLRRRLEEAAPRLREVRRHARDRRGRAHRRELRRHRRVPSPRGPDPRLPRLMLLHRSTARTQPLIGRSACDTHASCSAWQEVRSSSALCAGAVLRRPSVLFTIHHKEGCSRSR